MVQLVFVHGVATRPGPGYDQECRNRDKLFSEVLFEGAPLKIRAPLWGDLVPRMSRGGAAFAVKGAAALAGGLGEAEERQPEGSAIADLAKEDAAAALDAVYATMVERADAAGEDLSADDIRAFRAVSKAIAAGKAPDLSASTTDEELIFNIGEASKTVGSLGIGDKLKGAVVALADRARNTVSTGLSNAFRDDLNPKVGLFLGDVFIYLKDGPTRQAIRKRIAGPIAEAAAEAKKNKEKLVLMGHSLGGVVLYDMLSSKDPGLPADLSVDLFLTVGSQPGLFEEMGLFDFKSPDPKKATPGPASVKAWMNIFDPIDVFGFRTKNIFAMPTDFAFDSVTGLVSAHTTYFKRPQFHARARKRLQDLKII